MAEQTKAQMKRAEARGRRRDQANEGQSRENQDDGALEGNDEQPLEAVKQAAKVAVAGAAVGAAAAAARALTSRDHDDSEPEPTQEARAEEDQQPEPEEKPDEQKQQDSTQQPKASTQEPQDSTQEPEAQAEPPREQPRDEERHGAAPNEAKATVNQAREQLEALVDVPVESVSGFERTRNGWLVTLEVLELSRIPESTDVLASYEMELDDDRNLVRYTRGRRYHRSQADRGEQS
jgi:hypothetical protein